MKKLNIILIIMIFVFSFSVLSTAANSSIDWQAYKGQTVKVLLDAHPWQEVIDQHIDKFEELTGINVEITVLGEDVYWDRVTMGLSSPQPPFDVFMLSPNQTGFTAYQNKWIASLDKLLENPKLTDKSYNFNGFYPFVVDGFRFPDTEGKIYSIPLTMETYILFYRKDLLEEQNINVSTLETVDEWMKVLDKLESAYGDKGIVPAVIRGQDPTMPDELLAAVYNYWGDRSFIPQRMFYFDKNWTPRFTDSSITKGFELWAKLLNYGPEGATSFTWYDCVNYFAAGKAATYWFDASLFASIFENPDKSKVVGKVGYLPVPRTESGHGTTHWGWGISITENSKVKEAAWLFIQWATSPDIELITAPNTYGPVRESTWDQLAGTVFSEEYASAVDKSLKMSAPGYMYFPGAREVADRIIDAIMKMEQGKDPETVMNWLNNEAETIVERNKLK